MTQTTRQFLNGHWKGEEASIDKKAEDGAVEEEDLGDNPIGMPATGVGLFQPWAFARSSRKTFI